MIRFEEETSMARGEEEYDVMIAHGCAREEWVRGGDHQPEPVEDSRNIQPFKNGISGLHRNTTTKKPIGRILVVAHKIGRASCRERVYGLV